MFFCSVRQSVQYGTARHDIYSSHDSLLTLCYGSLSTELNTQAAQKIYDSACRQVQTCRYLNLPHVIQIDNSQCFDLLQIAFPLIYFRDFVSERAETTRQ